MLRQVIRLYIEEHLHGGAFDRFIAAREHNPDSSCAVVLLEDYARRVQCQAMLHAFWITLPPGPERDALMGMANYTQMERTDRVIRLFDGTEWHVFTCTHPDLVAGFFALFNPGCLSNREDEAEARYQELVGFLITHT